MALSNKPDMSVLWASNGSTDQPTNIKIAQGWISEIPPYETQNWWQLRTDQAIRHIYESGIAAWDGSTNYTAGRSLVQASNGVLYRALVDNVGQNPLTTSAWVAFIDESRYMQPGSIFYHAGPTAPLGSMKANGALVSRSAYPQLFAAISTWWGAGDGVNTFALPDLRGVFVRGWDDGRGVDLGRGFATVQQNANQSHSHSGNTNDAGFHNHGGVTAVNGFHNHGGVANVNGDHSHQLNTSGVRYNAIFTVDPNEGTMHTGSGSIRAGTTVNGNHQHSLSIDGNGAHQHGLEIYGAGQHSHAFTTNAVGANESRPINTALLACIKF